MVYCIYFLLIGFLEEYSVGEDWIGMAVFSLTWSCSRTCVCCYSHFRRRWFILGRLTITYSMEFQNIGKSKENATEAEIPNSPSYLWVRLFHDKPKHILFIYQLTSSSIILNGPGIRRLSFIKNNYWIDFEQVIRILINLIVINPLLHSSTHQLNVIGMITIYRISSTNPPPTSVRNATQVHLNHHYHV